MAFVGNKKTFSKTSEDEKQSDGRKRTARNDVI